ncbi:MAG TPA: oxygenase MpaB family protein [Gemmatimonadaceae bacterium]|nr:oxygenase MpaB family protein [Gemmatimonadaceae bacterium]
MTDFVRRGSIVRTIWGNADMILLVFAGSAAEFALNRAVDWLFFTGKVPSDPIGRLFSTAGYSQQIVFADEVTASATLNRIRAVHQAVEGQRGLSIPDWAHRDVLYMLIDYSERAHELLARPLSADEQRELYDVFYRVGVGLGIPELPASYAEWKADRKRHLQRDLLRGEATNGLYAAYRNHLGPWRYRLLLKTQAILAPEHVRSLMRLGSAEWLRPLFRVYPLLVRAGLRSVVRRMLMPPRYLPEVRGLDRVGRRTSSPTARTLHTAPPSPAG